MTPRRTPRPIGSPSDLAPLVLRALAAWVASASASAWAAEGDATSWLPWLVIGAIALLVLGIGARMVLAARFPKGYRAWAAERRDSFAERNEAFDRADEEFRK